MRSPRAALALLFLLAPSAARATTTSCAMANDGTPCSDKCVVGTCMGGVCKPGTLRPDGTACSTDNPCTMNDQCQSGMCIAGAPVVCPDQSACLVGVCSPRVGCTVKDVCPPDLAGPMDLAPTDAAPAPMDLMSTDLCTVPPGSEFFSCDNPPDGFFATSDLGDMSIPGEPFHVRGSRIGDCAFGGGDLGASSSVVMVLGLAVMVRRRRAP